MDWQTGATIEWSASGQEPTEGAMVAFDHGWLHLWSEHGIRSIPASEVREVRWKRGGGSRW